MFVMIERLYAHPVYHDTRSHERQTLSDP